MVEAVVENVAAREGADPTELDVPLVEVLDPDALRQLVDRSGRESPGSVRIEFDYHG